MNKYITFPLVLLAWVACGYCSAYGAGPAIQQISLSALPNIDHYLNGGASSYAPSPAYAAQPGAAASVSYAHAPSLAPATSIVVPSGPAYSGAAPAAYTASAPAPYAAPARSYGAAHKLSIQPAYATQLYPGQHNYKAYVSPLQHSKVALPIVPSEPVAKLFVPQQSSYAASAPQHAYSGGY